MTRWELAAWLGVVCVVKGSFEGASFGLPQYGHIAAFGDFNADKHADLFILRTVNDTSILTVYFWSSSEEKFVGSTTAVIEIEEETIANVSPGDYNYDGKLDVMLTLANSTVIYPGFITKFGIPITIPNAQGQLAVLDYNSDLRPDLFGLDSAGARTFWVHKEILNYVQLKMELPLGDNFTRITSPHSTAFVDLDGDCLADLFTTGENPQTHEQRFEFWINKKQSSFQLVRTEPMPPGAGHVTFADMDGDGTIDMLFPVCLPAGSCAESTVHIFYNIQKPMCPSIWDNKPYCRAQSDLCVADPNWALGNFSNMDTGTHDHVILNLDTLNAPGELRFNSQLDPLVVRLGDFDIDGYVDLLLPVQRENGFPFMTLWKSVACTAGTCDPAAVSAGRRYYVMQTEPSLENVPGGFAATFFDISDNGNLDLFVLSQNNNPNHVGETVALRNMYDEDAFFFTTLSSNGICPSWCSSGEKFPKYKPYGVNFHGSCIKFTVADLNGNKRVREGVQLSQNVYWALQTPYQLFGLGRTNNYIEEFYAGFSLRTIHWNSWVTLIPNSQIFVFPFPPNKPAEWTLELFIPPSARLVTVTLALLATLALILVPVVYFHRKQKKEDEAENAMLSPFIRI